MNTVVLPRAAVRLRAAGILMHAVLRAAVRDRVVMVFVAALLALGALDTAQLPASVDFVAGAGMG